MSVEDINSSNNSLDLKNDEYKDIDALRAKFSV
jgi:hypothetical protein